MAKVLLADESITIQKVVDLVLSEEGHEIKSVNNGEDALAAARTFSPDIILADIKLKGKNGYEIAREIKGDPQTMQVPVLLLAGAFNPVQEDLLKESGADGSLTKPFESQDLIEKINALLQGKAAPQAAPAAAGEEPVFAIEEEPGEAEPVFAIEEADESAVAEVMEAAPEEDLWDLGDLGEEAVEPVEAAVEAFEAEAVEAMPEEAAAVGVEEAAPQAPAAAMPAAGELSAIFREAVEAKLSEIANGIDLRELLLKTLEPHIKETVEKILWQVTPELTEKLLRESVKETLGSLNKDLENIIWETVPELAESIIRKEIEKIRAEN